MANFLDKFLITTASGKRHKKDLSCEHITTGDFMRLGTAYYHNMVPNEKLVVDFRAFSRLASMPVPTFGRANMNMRCFFVPFRTVDHAWNDFITDSVHVYADDTPAIPARTRGIQMNTLVNAINDYCVDGSSSDYDFVTVYQSAINYRKFTPFARDIYKNLLSLGYAFSFNLNGSDASTVLSALPLLAMMKVYVDWYWPSAYVGDPDYNSIVSILQRDTAGDLITKAELQTMFSWLRRVNYDSDYFVSAFDNPTGPTNGVSSTVTVKDPSSLSGSPSVISQESDDGDFGIRANTPFMGPNTITQYGIMALHRLTDYMKRHQLAGARALDRYLARFGVNLAPEKLNRSIYLGNHKIPLMTGDVFGTSDTLQTVSGQTTGSPLGSYAGKGYLVGKDGHFEYETNEYGIFFILFSIIPEVGYFQGIDRHNMHLTRLDFFTPEFDAMGTRAISSGELLLPINPTQAAWKDTLQTVFGYTPQYSEYKVGRDWLTGDYRCRTLSVAGETSNAWHLFRDVRGIEVQPIVHSRAFGQGGVDDDQYDRIFYNVRNTVDHFFLHFFFGVTSTAPMKPLYDTYDFEDEDNAKRVLDVNGVKMN